MVKHVDFDEQVTTDEGQPDMVIRLPNGGVIPVELKNPPMTAYFDALESVDKVRAG